MGRMARKGNPHGCHYQGVLGSPKQMASVTRCDRKSISSMRPEVTADPLSECSFFQSISILFKANESLNTISNPAYGHACLIWPTNRTGEDKTSEPRPLDWTLSWALPWTPSWDVSWELSGVLERLKTRKSTFVGHVVGALVGDLVGALVGPLVGPLVVPLVDPLVGRGSLSPALFIAHYSSGTVEISGERT